MQLAIGMRESRVHMRIGITKYNKIIAYSDKDSLQRISVKN